jgi:phosphatidate cytidylyltransferase
MNKMLKKSLVAVVLILCVVPPFLFGGVAMEILTAVVTFFASVEIASLEDGKRHYKFSIIIFIAVEMMMHTKDVTVSFSISMFLIFMFCCSIVTEKMTMDRVAYTFILVMVLTLAWRGILHIYNTGLGGLTMLFVAVACYMCDTGAYFIGSFFGRHKLVPRISPNKTWEGAVGGYAVAVACALLWGFLVMKPNVTSPIPDNLIWTASFLLPLMAEIGDLSFSAVKRRWGIKDYGSLLPGHGGVLDRVDSLLFCLMTFNGLLILWGI